jgi:hypothetical protein
MTNNGRYLAVSRLDVATAEKTGLTESMISVIVGQRLPLVSCAAELRRLRLRRLYAEVKNFYTVRPINTTKHTC